MDNKLTKIRLKRNESFTLREGWLHKGIALLQNRPDIFSCNDAASTLGIGSKMVKSLKYWLLVTNLVREQIVKSKHNLVLTEDLGSIVYKYDPYFEDVFTLYILHNNMAKNIDLATVVYLFFNKFDAHSFEKSNMMDALELELKKLLAVNATFSAKLFRDDCNSLLKMYVADVSDVDPEEDLGCPFSSLGLLKKNILNNQVFDKTAPNFDRLDCLVLMYIMLSSDSENTKSTSVMDLLSKDNGAGKLLNLNRAMLNEYLDQLRIRKYITINRTAGLDTIYFNETITPAQVLINYYTQADCV